MRGLVGGRPRSLDEDRISEWLLGAKRRATRSRRIGETVTWPRAAIAPTNGAADLPPPHRADTCCSEHARSVTLPGRPAFLPGSDPGGAGLGTAPGQAVALTHGRPTTVDVRASATR